MTTYLLTSTKWSGEIELRYDDDGYLLSYDNRAGLDDRQRYWFLDNMPREVITLQNLVAAATTAKLTEVKVEVTFELFWSRYDDKVNSSKKRAEAKWRQMSKGEQLRAYMHIPRYFANIPHGTRKKFAETYLNAELWNN